VGLLGGRAASLDVGEAVDLLERGLRGRRRRAAVWRRVDGVLHQMATRLSSGDPPDPHEVTRMLDRLVGIEPPGHGVTDAPVVALATAVADPDLMDRVGVWLGGHPGRRLCELGNAERGAVTFAVVDLETAGDGSVRELAVVRTRAGRVLGRLSADGPVD